jgi:hypothetical protein
MVEKDKRKIVPLGTVSYRPKLYRCANLSLLEMAEALMKAKTQIRAGLMVTCCRPIPVFPHPIVPPIYVNPGGPITRP